jgi:hypothetical protein
MLKAQSDYAQASFSDAMAQASRFGETWMTLAREAIEPFSGRYAVAVEKIKTVAIKG